jgi:cytochrome c oxidase cbb3-type subunit 3
MLLDHNYDGIHELNNHLPPWWVYLFYITIIFAVVYLFNYHVLNLQPLPSKEYALEMETAAKEVALYKKMYANNIDETNVKITTDASELAAGKEVYLKECKACHGEKGEGGTGPNLTDEFWLHGGDIKYIFKTIKVGVQEKGMISWEKKLKPDVMRNVASYIITLQGTNPPNAKAPQGEKFESKKMSQK